MGVMFKKRLQRFVIYSITQVRSGTLSSIGSCNTTKRLVQHKDGAHKVKNGPSVPRVL